MLHVKRERHFKTGQNPAGGNGISPFCERLRLRVDGSGLKVHYRAMATIDAVIAAARLGLERLEPIQAAEDMKRGVLLIDIRPLEGRLRDGEIPGAVAIHRNVLEWRLDPTSPHRIPQMAELAHDTKIILICNEGYSSSLAAASLQRLGLTGTTDVIGGFQAWIASGLPVRPMER